MSGDPVTATGERRLSAIMFTDMVGYSALTERDERLALQLLEEHRQLIRPLLNVHAGREIKNMADGLLVEFPSAISAVECAMAIQRVLRARNLNRRIEKIEIRIGIHLGDNVVQDGDVLGNAVNVASRIEKVAEPGGICVSEDVARLVRNRSDVRLVSLGAPSLKNISSPVEVFRIDEATITTPSNAKTASIAVLPFVNISSEAENEYFSDGLTEDIITQLSKVGALKVISRTSAMQYKGTGKSLRSIGQELGVATVLEGSVRKANDRIRIAAQLIDAATDVHLWAETYDRELRDIFEVQSEVAESIATALRAQITPVERGRIEHRPTNDLEAYQCYLRGRSFLNTRTEDGLNRAVACFDQATKSDPSYGEALAGLADAYAFLALFEFLPPREAFPVAREAAERALRAQPELAEAHASLGLIKFQFDWDFPAAERELRTATEANANYATGHHFFADYLKGMGRFDEALQQIQIAKELDPLSLAINSGVGHVLYLSRQYERAIEAYRHTLELNPNFVQARLWFGRPYLQTGRYAEAIEELEQAAKLSSRSTISLAVLAHAYAAAGKQEKSETILEELKVRSANSYVSSYWIAMIYVGLGNSSQAFDYFEKAYEEKSAWLAWANVEPRFDPLRADPRFQSLIRRIGF